MEAALAHTLADFGICSLQVATAIDAAARKVTAEAVYEEEKTTHHELKAVINCIQQQLPTSARPYVHFGATSYDIIATANTLQTRGAMTELIMPRLRSLLKTLITLAEKYADVVQVGRTHGQHAVPITFGFAMAEYVSRLGDSIRALQVLTEELPGKFSGAVGAYNALSVFINNPMEFEKAVLAKMGLKPAAYSTQIVPPESTIRLIDELTIVAGIMANLAHDMRHLQRTEIGEVREKFAKGQTGSSTMAHKRNPWNFENVVSMSKQVVAQSLNANLNITSEHQRDLTDSASARFYGLPLALVASMAERLDMIMSKLEVDEEAMQRNLQISGGAIAAEPFYLLLTKYGHPSAHEKAKQLAHLAIEQRTTLVDIINKDSEASDYWQRFTKEEQQIINKPEIYYIGLAAKKTRIIVGSY